MLKEILQTKPDIKNMNINYIDLYFTVIKIRDENKIIDNEYEDDYHDYIDINQFYRIPQSMGRRNDNEILSNIV